MHYNGVPNHGFVCRLLLEIHAIPHPRPHWVMWILLHAKYDNSFLITDMIKQKVLAGKNYNRTDHYTYLSDLQQVLISNADANTCGSYADTKQEGTFQQVSFAVHEERSISSDEDEHQRLRAHVAVHLNLNEQKIRNQPTNEPHWLT